MRRLSRRALLLTPVAAQAVATKSPVIDTHMHVWSMDTAKYPFRPPEPNYRLPSEEGSVEIYREEMKKDGVDLVDIGGENIRPQSLVRFGVPEFSPILRKRIEPR